MEVQSPHHFVHRMRPEQGLLAGLRIASSHGPLGHRIHYLQHHSELHQQYHFQNICRARGASHPSVILIECERGICRRSSAAVLPPRRRRRLTLV